MFPALRQNGIARWLAVVLALFGLAAGMLLALALSLSAMKNGASGRQVSTHAELDASAAGTGTVRTR